MRDILLLLIVFGSLPLILQRPYIGIIVWSWLSYMNPHRLTYGFAYDFPFAFIVAVVLLFSMLITKEKLSIPISGLTSLWIIFVLWMCIATFFAIYPDSATIQLIKILKIQLITFATIMLMTTKNRIELLIWTIVISIGFYGFKGGLFTLLTGGSYRVYGPPGGFIEENNSLALALLMILPLMYFLRQHAENIWLKRGLLLSMIFIAFSIFGSQSRGALIGIIATAIFLVLKSKHKAAALLAMIILGIAAVTFMPESWHDRMNTIANYEEDASAMGRINAWLYSINVANDRITGAGLESWTPSTFAQYAPNPTAVHAAHSIYFGVLADHGWIGLIIWISILIAAWRSNSWIIHHAKSHEGLTWAVDLAKMLQVSMISYCAAGTFLSLSYFDLPWHIFAIIVILKSIVEKEQKTKNQIEQNVPVEKITG